MKKKLYTATTARKLRKSFDLDGEEKMGTKYQCSVSINLEILGRLFWQLPYSHWTENLQSLQPRASAFHCPQKEDKPWANTRQWPFQGVRSRSPAVFEMQRGQCSCLNRGIECRLSWQVQHSTYPRRELCTSGWTLGGIHWSISDATNKQNCF